VITLPEYNRRWELIMEAFRAGRFSQREASDAVRELTSIGIAHKVQS
jgi:hypothetical protein